MTDNHLSLRWADNHFVGFVMSRLNSDRCLYNYDRTARCEQSTGLSTQVCAYSAWRKNPRVLLLCIFPFFVTESRRIILSINQCSILINVFIQQQGQLNLTTFNNFIHVWFRYLNLTLNRYVCPISAASMHRPKSS